MKLTDQPKDLVKAVQEVMKTTTPPADKQKLSDSLASRYENMRPKQIDEKVDPEAERVARLKSTESLRPEIEKKFQENPKGVEVHMKHKKTGKVEVTKFPGTVTAVAAAKRHIADMEKQGYKLHAKKLMEDETINQEEQDINMDKKQLVVEKMMKKLNGKLDPVGKEDTDVDNDGDTDKSDSYLKNRRKAIAAAMKKEETEQQNNEQIDEASYLAKSARAGKDIGKPGKMFSKIAASAAKRYGSAEAGKRVAGSILKKLRAKK